MSASKPGEHTIETMQIEERRYKPSPEFSTQALRDVSENRPLGDTTTLADPTVVAEIARRGKEEAGKDEG